MVQSFFLMKILIFGSLRNKCYAHLSSLGYLWFYQMFKSAYWRGVFFFKSAGGNLIDTPYISLIPCYFLLFCYAVDASRQRPFFHSNQSINQWCNRFSSWKSLYLEVCATNATHIYRAWDTCDFIKCLNLRTEGVFFFLSPPEVTWLIHHIYLSFPIISSCSVMPLTLRDREPFFHSNETDFVAVNC